MTLPTPYYSREGIVIYHSDCLALLPELPSGSVDAVVTDSPYGVNYKSDAPFDDSPEWWMASAVKAIRYCIESDFGPVLAFGAAPTLDRDREALKPERMIVWAPSFTLSHSRKDGVFFRWHPLYAWKLGEASTPPEEAGEALHSDVLTEPTDAVRTWWNHPATKPLSLMRRLVRIVDRGQTILDPFLGSGTTAVACIKTGRKCLGIEISEAYCAIAARRCEEAFDSQALFRQEAP